MSRLPRTYGPQLAALVKTPPEGDEWLHEMQYDGYRIGCRINRGNVTLLSRNGKDWTALPRDEIGLRRQRRKDPAPVVPGIAAGQGAA